MALNDKIVDSLDGLAKKADDEQALEVINALPKNTDPVLRSRYFHLYFERKAYYKESENEKKHKPYPIKWWNGC